jgi:hypothetical protein
MPVQDRQYLFRCKISKFYAMSYLATGTDMVIRILFSREGGQVLEVYDPFGNRIRFCQS